MPIILEGPDAAGKTTLSNLIQKLNPKYRYYASGGPPKSTNEMMGFCVDQLNLCTEKHMILDRITPISQPVYNDSLEGWEIQFLASMAHAMLCLPSVILIYCRPSDEHLLNPKSHNWKDYDTPQHIQMILQNQAKIICSYDRIMTTFPHITYDFMDEDSSIEIASRLAIFDDVVEAQQELKELTKCVHSY